MTDYVDIITAVVGFVTGGGLTALFTLKERRRGAAIDNVQKMAETNGRTNDEWQELVEAHKRMAEDFKADADRKGMKIDELYKELSVMRDKADKLGSKVAYLTTMKCKVIGCPNRVPPFGSPDAKANGEAREAK